MANAAQPDIRKDDVESLPEEIGGPDFCPSLVLVMASAVALHISGHFLFDPLSWPQFGKELVGLRDALPIVQAVLIAGWGVLGPGPWYVRWPGSIVLLASMAAVPAWRYGWENVIYLWGVMGMAAWGAISLAVLFAWRGYAVDWPRGKAEGTVRWQFSLAHLIGITTAVAVTTGVLRWCYGWWPAQFGDLEFIVGVAALGLGFSVSGAWIGWEVLRPESWWLTRIAALLLAPILPVVGWFIAAELLPPRGLRFFGMSTFNNYLIDFAYWGVAFTLLLGITLWVARESGLRLIVVGGPGREGGK